VTYSKSKFTGNVNYLFIGRRENSRYTINGVMGPIPNRINLSANFIYKPDTNNSISLTFNNIFDRDNSLNRWENLDMPFNWILSYNYSF